MGSTAVRGCWSEKNANIVGVQTDILGDNSSSTRRVDGSSGSLMRLTVVSLGYVKERKKVWK